MRKLMSLTLWMVIAVSAIAAPLTGPPAPFAGQRSKGGKVITKPILKPRGIQFGEKGIFFNRDGSLRLQAGGRQIAKIYCSFASSFTGWMPIQHRDCINRKFVADPEKRQFQYDLDYPIAKSADGKKIYAHYQLILKLLPDDLVNIKITMTPPESHKKDHKSAIMHWELPMAKYRGKQHVVNGKAGCFTADNEKTPADLKPESRNARKGIFSNFAETIEIAADDPRLRFKLQANKHWTDLFECWHKFSKAFVWLRFHTKNRTLIDLTLDLRQNSATAKTSSRDIHAGIDFWKSDRLHVPDFSGRKNLIQNPSFEAGARYFTPVPNIAVDKSSHYYPLHTIDEKEAAHGRKSLRVRAVKALGEFPATMNTFAIPLVEGKTYTFSCRAKGNRKDGLFLKVIATTGQWPEMIDIGKFKLSDQWQTFQHTFKATNNAIKFSFAGINKSNVEEAVINVDAVQLEGGEQATDFICRSFEAELLSSNPDNFLTPNDKPELKLSIQTAPNSAGTVKLTLSDYFYSDIWTQTLTFTTDKQGQAVLPLDIKKLPTGIMVLRGDFKLADGSEDTEWFRVAVMDKLSNTHRWKDFFSTGLWIRTPLLKKILERCRDIGFGSTCYLRDEKEYFDLVKSYGITPYGNEIFSSRHDGSVIADGKVLVSGLFKIKEVSPELEKQVEEASYKRARSLPFITSWFFSCENKLIFSNLLPHNPKTFSRLLIAANKGVKRFNPKADFWVEGGPANMMPGNGIRELESYIKAIDGEVEFDGTACHPYRASPEEPDLDADAKQCFDMLDRNGYGDKPVYWNEGIYYAPYSIPDWGLSVHAGYDHWRVGPPSYHMSWSERLSAAYYARSWIIGLKYQDRVKLFNGWSYWFFMDNNLTPFALQKIPNTLGRLLGNAVFKKDIRFAPNVRCYLFEDEKKRPVAALWSHFPKVDSGDERCPEALIKFNRLKPEFFDLMEVRREAVTNNDGATIVPVTPFPLFIRGEVGTLNKLATALENGELIGYNSSPLRITANPLDADRLRITVRNLLTRPFEGTISFNSNGKQTKQQLTLGGNAVKEIDLPLLLPISRNAISIVKLPVTLTEQSGRQFNTDCSFKAFAVARRKQNIVIDGKLDDWQDVPAIRISNPLHRKPKFARDQEKVGYPGDFGAQYKMCWDQDNLYLAVIVEDDKLLTVRKGKIGGWWNNDALQVYFDTIGDGRTRIEQGFDGNDYNYDFFPDPANHNATAYRRFAPEKQQAGGLTAPKPDMIEPNIKTALAKTANGYVYEIAFPARYIAPLNLEANSSSGFAIIVNDRDDKMAKHSLTMTPPETEPFRRPDYYPVMLLTK